MFFYMDLENKTTFLPYDRNFDLYYSTRLLKFRFRDVLSPFITHFKVRDFLPLYRHDDLDRKVMLDSIGFDDEYLMIHSYEIVDMTQLGLPVDKIECIKEVFERYKATSKALKIHHDQPETVLNDLLHQIMSDRIVLIRSQTFAHVNAIVIFKDSLYFFNRQRGSGPAKLFNIDRSILSTKILKSLLFNESPGEVIKVIRGIQVDKEQDPLPIRVIGYQYSGSCMNEYLKDFFWALFKIQKVSSFFPQFIKLVLKNEWNRMLNAYKRYAVEYVEWGVFSYPRETAVFLL